MYDSAVSDEVVSRSVGGPAGHVERSLWSVSTNFMGLGLDFSDICLKENALLIHIASKEERVFFCRKNGTLQCIKEKWFLLLKIKVLKM